jgi:hypothetical protein
MPAEAVFSANDLRDYQPELAARLEEEIREAVAEGTEVGTLQCRITERRAERAMVVVLIEGDQWTVTFSVSAPPAIGEVKSETRRALRDRGRRTPSYRRSTRR